MHPVLAHRRKLIMRDEVIANLAPRCVLRVAINFGNLVLAQKD
jgi:hypothetical protein